MATVTAQCWQLAAGEWNDGNDRARSEHGRCVCNSGNTLYSNELPRKEGDKERQQSKVIRVLVDYCQLILPLAGLIVGPPTRLLLF